MRAHSLEYREYLNSLSWKARAHRLKSAAAYCCQKCGTRSFEVQVHHLNYERLGDELDSDLQVLCPTCHKRADQERQAHTRSKRRNARLDAWATKRYGEDWHLFEDPELVEGEFHEWLDREGLE